jgi:3-hydroxyisobutyrate dehydrogenase-like beta-hydroxyacid dehydrogenase
MRVGVIGLGIMGGAFAQNLVKAGWKVIGYDIDAARSRAARKAGVEIAASVQALAQATKTIITSLPSPAALEQIMMAITQAQLSPRIVVEASTFGLGDKIKAERALHRHGHILLDCPVSGTGAQARVKDLVIYASGDTAAIRKLRPLFAAFSRAAHDLGAFGNGSRMKYVANLLVAIHNVASAEAMVLGLKAGLDPQTVFEMVRTGAGNSRVFELRAPMMVQDRYDKATMKISIWQKDMAVIGEFARELRCPTPLFDATVPVYDEALKSDLGEQDTAAVCAVLENKAGLKRQRKRKNP